MRIPFQLLMITLLLSTLAASVLSGLTGAVQISLGDAIESIMQSITSATAGQAANVNSETSLSTLVLFELRIPRIALALMVGCILAQCGAVLQGLFRNPLADPGIIGVSSGAAVGAIIAIVLLPANWKAWSVPVCAFAAGLSATLLVYTLARSARGTSVVILLLAGVAVSAFSGAAIGLLTYFADDNSLRELSVWQMGSLSKAKTEQLPLVFVCCLALIILFQKHINALNALLLGESEARHMGIDVERFKRNTIVLVAIGVGICVAYTGIIGFIGLVVPHVVRMLCGPNHRFLLPISAVMGGLLLILSDLLARTLIAPSELPIGLITALIGAPFFVSLLLRERKRWAL
ncbi:iron ABC transporter permease [Oleiphilus sp. HI0071]|nr:MULTISPECIES: iron ABC transporter permease [unclassified Oleiphilus]KZY72580.1 iron ABC transporter permease [Oleiphilus sp. HI0065]KZY82840.1 iron ABC transporter permease [Oleiphilus sp. HI0071]KZZ04847.1 iron ABC transporter permease [Oleiphilus sp. HI0073]KZZ49146.1 iron ABC transporter permease [Oleiphilus sp. HI0122]KZZ81263.1 iron ABC transporter permease [Oleiphilus sp. HI0133]